MTHQAMHNPGRPVRGGSGGLLPPQRSSPTLCPTRVRGLEEHQKQVQIQIIGRTWLDIYSLIPSHASIYGGTPPQDTSGRAHYSHPRSCSHSRPPAPTDDTWDRNPCVYANETENEAGPHAPDLHVHLHPLTAPIPQNPISRSKPITNPHDSTTASLRHITNAPLYQPSIKHLLSS